MTAITVYKCDERGQVKLSYAGDVLERGKNWICIRAIFQHDDVDIGVVTFNRGDRMLEWFYADRYYNIFQLENGSSGQIKGWYCNITRPARITEVAIMADDLALDIFVAVDGTITVLDEDEFATLDLTKADREQALHAVTTLKQRVINRKPPFDHITDD